MEKPFLAFVSFSSATTAPRGILGNELEGSFMSDVITLSTNFTYSVDTISDTPIFNALAAATAPFSHDAARRPTHRAPATLSRSCVMPRGSMGGRHRRAATHAEHPLGSGRHRLVTASGA
jgi:hypothetical protein